MSLFMDQNGIFFRTSINFTAVYSHHFFVTQRNDFQMLEPERQNGDVLFFEIQSKNKFETTDQSGHDRKYRAITTL